MLILTLSSCQVWFLIFYIQYKEQEICADWIYCVRLQKQGRNALLWRCLLISNMTSVALHTNHHMHMWSKSKTWLPSEWDLYIAASWSQGNLIWRQGQQTGLKLNIITVLFFSHVSLFFSVMEQRGEKVLSLTLICSALNTRATASIKVIPWFLLCSIKSHKILHGTSVLQYEHALYYKLQTALFSQAFFYWRLLSLNYF